MSEFCELAPAKLNLYLHILGRRADGYHLLDSLVAFADIGDVVRAAPADALTLASDGPFAQSLPEQRDANLVWRAAQLLAERLEMAPKATITLTKNLPVASGIGGGSSDAAATLRALVRLWRVRIDDAELGALAARLGSDVPVCLKCRAAWLGGVGEVVEPAPPLPEVGVVLANPGVSLPTADVYRACPGILSAAARFIDAPGDAAHLGALLSSRRNDLADPAASIVPAIRDVLRELQASKGTLLARMSGSGATCFALYCSRVEAAGAARSLAERRPQWWVRDGVLFQPAGEDNG